ncbi:hypothetical protein DVH24_012293 [Malus domestica]|uniref:Uncharacterized protein n=1 Tax=Malus domestica TaxID=3750 RepID=A0A498HNZ3_MALDO|nr:hypothetical protein DVH24_012293 [Malus domestica]
MQRTISAVKMAHDMEKQWRNLSELSGERCIYRVPERLRQVNEKAYTPQVVSIGPLHHDNKSLKAMEEHKLRYLRHFLSRTRVRLFDYIQMVQRQEERLRGSYAEPIVFDKDEFVRIVSVDAAFVLEVLLRFHYSNYTKEDDYIFKNPTMKEDVVRDLKLLENQLPFFILQDLFTFFPYSPEHPSLLKISCTFFQSQIDSKGKEKYDEIGVEVKHFVDLIRILYLQMKPKTTDTPKTTLCDRMQVRLSHSIFLTSGYTPNATATPNVTELHQAGVKFKEGKDSRLIDIKFSSGILGICGILEIPKLRVDDTTDLTLRNLLAFEQCHHRGKDYLANYVFLMKRLVKTQDDVQLLAEKGIIDNWLVDTQKVSTLLRDLGTGMLVDNSHYATLLEELTNHRAKHWPKWMVILKQNYFNSPWSTISVAAAVILLILTLLQTVCSLKSVPL